MKIYWTESNGFVEECDATELTGVNCRVLRFGSERSGDGVMVAPAGWDGSPIAMRQVWEEDVECYQGNLEPGTIVTSREGEEQEFLVWGKPDPA